MQSTENPQLDALAAAGIDISAFQKKFVSASSSADSKESEKSTESDVAGRKRLLDETEEIKRPNKSNEPPVKKQMSTIDKLLARKKGTGKSNKLGVTPLNGIIVKKKAT